MTSPRERLGAHIRRTRQVLVDFKDDGWAAGLGEFDAIVTNQAVHELRHKKHAVALHRSARNLLRPRGVYLVCDHYVGTDGMSNASLYMTVDEQRTALQAAGFVCVANLPEMKGLVRSIGRASMRDRSNVGSELSLFALTSEVAE